MPVIEYFYSAHSAYAYLGSKRLLELCKAHGVTLHHKPIVLTPVVEASGAVSFAKRSRAHVDYFFGRELERWAAFREVPIIGFRPTHHDNPLDLPNGMLIAASETGADVDALSHAVLEAHWRDDADIADQDTLARIAKSVDVDPQPLLDAALSQPIQAIHAANGADAKRRSVFGSPCYFLDGDMYYGQDHLELMERALSKPYPPFGFKNP